MGGENLMAKDEFSKGSNSTTIKKGALEKRVGPEVPMNEQKPPGVKPEVSPRTQARESTKHS